MTETRVEATPGSGQELFRSKDFLGAVRRHIGLICLGDPWHIWTVFGPALLCLSFWWFQARFGFSATDDGEMLAQSWRIIQGQVPHVEFDAIRPAGSPVIHIPFLFLGGDYALATDRLFVTVELVVIASCLMRLATDHLDLRPIQSFALLAVAFLLNVGTWPIMAWHSIDGLFLASLAAWAFSVGLRKSERGSMVWVCIAWVLAGSSVLCKQGFALVPVGLAFWAVLSRRSKWLLFAPLAALGPAAYLLWVGSVDLIRSQVTRSTSSSDLLLPALAATEIPQRAILWTVMGSVLAVVAAKGIWVGAKIPRQWRGSTAAALLIVVLLVPAVQQGLSIVGQWPFVITLSLVVVSCLTVRSWERAGAVLFLLILAYSVSLSRGVAGPGLVAGSLAVAAVALLLASSKKADAKTQSGTSDLQANVQPGWSWLTIILGVSLLAVTIVSSRARAANVYQEGTRSKLTYTSSEPGFRLIRMSERSSAYLSVLGQCLRRYPSRTTAVIPDGPAIYALLRLRNPFRNDWFQPGEIDYLMQGPGEKLHESDINAVVARLNHSADWLVLTQSRTFTEYQLARDVMVPGEPFGYFPGDRTVVNRLDGTPVRCGAFIGKYRPR